MNNLSITVIVCAYNEQVTLPGILEELTNSYYIDEIIVINDGSTDNTGKVLENFLHEPKVKVIEFPYNRGKGYAMSVGIVEAHGDILVFVDADLVNFKERYIVQLIQPLLKEEADMVIGQPTESIFNKLFNPLKPLSGERAVLRKDIIHIVDKIMNTGYGVETIINLYYRANNKKIKIVHLWGLKHLIKFDKYSTNRAAYSYFHEALQISRHVIKNYFLILIIIRNMIGRILWRIQGLLWY